jgi:hypothetical protein
MTNCKRKMREMISNILLCNLFYCGSKIQQFIIYPFGAKLSMLVVLRHKRVNLVINKICETVRSHCPEG